MNHLEWSMHKQNNFCMQVQKRILLREAIEKRSVRGLHLGMWRIPCPAIEIYTTWPLPGVCVQGRLWMQCTRCQIVILTPAAEFGSSSKI